MKALKKGSAKSILADYLSDVPTLYSVSAASHLLNVSAATVRRWADTGKLRALRLVNGSRVFEEQELRRLKTQLQEK